ncbi:hypothetical protein O6H91_06G116000 [Diphasiastrum complanatum]|uniref:Uncharacterized protein n=1 Tax=Diphasiastrum complanatum TaxID=34168 RepID=A0ACC2DIP7_DIPCM|nr:hypothetical protein O6H91_06G116000 [Diphasiastrum complanatum]
MKGQYVYVLMCYKHVSSAEAMMVASSNLGHSGALYGAMFTIEEISSMPTYTYALHLYFSTSISGCCNLQRLLPCGRLKVTHNIYNLENTIWATFSEELKINEAELHLPPAAAANR